MSFQNNVAQIVGRVAIDSTYRDRFFNNVEETLTGYDLNPVEAETLRRMSNCPVTRMGTAMVNKTHGKHKSAAQKTAGRLRTGDADG